MQRIASHGHRRQLAVTVTVARRPGRVTATLHHDRAATGRKTTSVPGFKLHVLGQLKNLSEVTSVRTSGFLH